MDQPCPGVGLLAVVGQQLQDPFADAGVVGIKLGQDLGGDAVTPADQAEQEVLGADVVVAQLQRLPQRQVEDLLGPGREGRGSGWGGPAETDDLLDAQADGSQGDAQRLQRLVGNAVVLPEQAEQEVLGADVVVVEVPAFLLSEHDRSSRPVGEAGEPVLLPGPASWDRQPTSHRCSLRAGVGRRLGAQPGRQPVRYVRRPERAGGQFADQGAGRLGRVKVNLPAVEGEELQHGHERDLLVAAPQRLVAYQCVQQPTGPAGRVSPVAARSGLGQRRLGGGAVQQVQHPIGVQVERPAGDQDQVGDLQRDHGWSSRSSWSTRWWRARLSSSRARKRLSLRRCSTSPVMASRTRSETDRPSTAATACRRSASSGSSRNSRFLVLPGFTGMVISRYHPSVRWGTAAGERRPRQSQCASTGGPMIRILAVPARTAGSAGGRSTYTQAAARLPTITVPALSRTACRCGRPSPGYTEAADAPTRRPAAAPVWTTR